jgi:hypothetical protein
MNNPIGRVKSITLVLTSFLDFFQRSQNKSVNLTKKSQQVSLGNRLQVWHTQ